MGSFSVWHWLVVLAVILLLFGGGNKISGVMADLARGVRAFKKNIAEPEDAVETPTTTRPSPTLADFATTSSSPKQTVDSSQK